MDGKQIKKRLGKEWTDKGRPKAGYLTAKMAEDSLDDLMVSYRRGEIVVQDRTSVMFGQAVDHYVHWLEHDRKRKVSYIVSLRYVSTSSWPSSVPRRPSRRSWGPHRRLPQGSPGEGPLRVHDQQAPDRAQRHLQLACKDFGLRTNPVANVPKQPIPNRNNFNTYEPDEILALADAALSEGDAALLLVAGFCGLRLGEIRALQWQDIRWDEKSIIVRHNYVLSPDTPKSGMNRPVPLPDDVASALKKAKLASRFMARDDLVFPNESGEVQVTRTIRRRFKAAIKAAGLRSARFHDLRHSAATLMARIYPNVFDVMKYMGHSSLEITRKYVHHRPQASAADAMTDMIARSRKRAA